MAMTTHDSIISSSHQRDQQEQQQQQQANVACESEYKLFPELHNQLPSLPTFSDVFAQYQETAMRQQATQQQEQTTTTTTATTMLADAAATDVTATTYSSSTSSSSSSSSSASSSSNASTTSTTITTTNTPAVCVSTSHLLPHPDLFGLAGLVAKLRTTRCTSSNSSSSTDGNTMQLAMGEDLTTFGLDLASQGDIYVHFNGPFTQQPAGRSSANCALELGMRGMRDAMEKYPSQPPVWDPFVPETRNLGLLLPVPKSSLSSLPVAASSRKKST